MSSRQYHLHLHIRMVAQMTKSVGDKLLKEKVEVLSCLVPSALETIYIIDGMALVLMMKSAGASTFGELASNYFTIVVAPLL